MKPEPGLIVPIIVAAACCALAVAIGGPEIVLTILVVISAISAVVFIAGCMTGIGKRLVLAAIWLTITAAWVSAVFMDVTTPSAFYLANLQSCILMTLLAGTLLAASYSLAGPCLRLGAKLKHPAAPSHEARQPRAGSEAQPAGRSRSICPTCGSRVSQQVEVAAAHH